MLSAKNMRVAVSAVALSAASGASSPAATSVEIVSAAQATSPDILYINMKYAPIALKTDKQIAAAVASSKGSNRPAGVLHLCECVDCNKTMFAK